jgi:ribosomal protein L11 methyltransferase
MSTQPPGRYPYVQIVVDADEVDDAAALLFELGARGVEERDETTLVRGHPGKTTLLGCFDRSEDARAAARDLPPRWSPRVEEVVGDAWRDEWKKYFEPFHLAGHVVVSPPWREYAPGQDETVIVLEPGRAFGTGLHETTRLVAGALVAHAPRFAGRAVLDVGCGSGILSLVALASGAASALAIDIDAEAVLAARENAARNSVGERLRAEAIPLGAVRDRYAAVVANIEARTLEAIAPELVRVVEPGGLLVLSGILTPGVAPGQLVAVRRAYAGLGEDEVLVAGEWAALVLTR